MNDGRFDLYARIVQGNFRRPSVEKNSLIDRVHAAQAFLIWVDQTSIEYVIKLASPRWLAMPSFPSQQEMCSREPHHEQ